MGTVGVFADDPNVRGLRGPSRVNSRTMNCEVPLVFSPWHLPGHASSAGCKATGLKVKELVASENIQRRKHISKSK